MAGRHGAPAAGDGHVPFVGQRLRWFIAREKQEDIGRLVDLVEDGTLRPVVDRTFGLPDAVEALRYVAEGRARGKVLITV